MSSHRKTSLAAGVLYLLTFVSIPTLALYCPVRGANYILGAGPDTGALVGAILEIIVALAGIGTAAALYPVLKRQNEGVAMGFVGSRTLHASGERRVAGLPAVPVAPGAARSSSPRIHRSDRARRSRPRRFVRPHRPN